MRLERKICLLFAVLMVFAMSASAFIPGIQPLERNVPRVGTIVYPGAGQSVQYVYDGAGQVTGVTAWGGRQWSFKYDANGNLTNILYPNGVTAARAYNDNDQLESYSYSTNGTPFIRRSFQRDLLGQKKVEDITAGTLFKPAVAASQTRNHDDGDQLNGVTHSTSNLPPSTDVLSYSAVGCLTQEVVHAGATVVTNTYGWNCYGLLTSASGGSGSSTEYIYDAAGARVARISVAGGGDPGSTNYFVLNYSDPLKRPLAETDSSGKVTRYYIWGPSGLLAHLDAVAGVADPGSIRYYHTDELTSTLALTDANGSVKDEFGYSPYGELLGHTGSTETPYRWLGGIGIRLEDQAQQRYFMNRRYYSAAHKRFLSRDPSGLDGGPNAYLYASANPLAFVDPYGLCPTWASSVPTCNYSFEDGLRGAMAPGIAAASMFNPANVVQGMANEYQANYNYSGSHYDAANLTFNPVTKFGVNGYQAATGNGISYNNYGTQLSTGQRIGSGVAAGFNALEAVGVGYGGAKLLTYTGITAPAENFAVRTYLNRMDRSQYISSAVEGTARLNIGFGGRRLFRVADTPASGMFGEFASIERPATPAQGIQGNALFTGNQASQLYQVKTRFGFYVEGVVAPQGVGFPGGFRQAIQIRPGENVSPWRSVQEIGYSTKGTP